MLAYSLEAYNDNLCNDDRAFTASMTSPSVESARHWVKAYPRRFFSSPLMTLRSQHKASAAALKS